MLPGMNGCSTVATARSTSASTRSTCAHAQRIGLAQRPGRLAVDIAVGRADHLPRLLQRRRGTPAGDRRRAAAPAGAAPPRSIACVVPRSPAPRRRQHARRSCAQSATGSAAPGCRGRWPARHSSGVISARRLKSPSLPNGTSRSRKKRTASSPNSATSVARVDHVAERLAHLLALDRPPAMRVDRAAAAPAPPPSGRPANRPRGTGRSPCRPDAGRPARSRSRGASSSGQPVAVR